MLQNHQLLTKVILKQLSQDRRLPAFARATSDRPRDSASPNKKPEMTSSVETTWLANNAEYVKSFKDGDKPLPPAKKVRTLCVRKHAAFAWCFPPVTDAHWRIERCGRLVSCASAAPQPWFRSLAAGRVYGGAARRAAAHRTRRSSHAPFHTHTALKKAQHPAATPPHVPGAPAGQQADPDSRLALPSSPTIPPPYP